MSKDKNPGYWDNYKCSQPAQQNTDYCAAPSLYPDDDGLPPVDDDMSKKDEKRRNQEEKYYRQVKMHALSEAEGDIPNVINGLRQFTHREITIDLAALKGEILAGRRLSKVGFNMGATGIMYTSGRYDCPTNAQVAVDMSTFYYLKKKYLYVGNSKKGLLTYLEGMMAAYCLINHR